MTRARPLDGTLAALSALAVTLPLTGLFSPVSAWARPSLLLVLVVLVTGLLARGLSAPRPVVVGAQLLVLLEASALLHLRGHLVAGLLPGPDAVRALGIHLDGAYTVVTSYAAPAPSERGIVVAVSLLVGLTALAVDALGVTYRSPAVAGIPLLTAFLAGATNTSAGLAAWYVAPPALCWLALVAGQGMSSLREWGGSPHRDGRADPADSFATLARGVGVLALGAAVVVPALVPHLPPTFVADGLARGDGRGNSTGPVLLSTSLDVARDLADRSDAEVLRYRTSAGDPVPLRVGLLEAYRGGRWSSRDGVTYVPPDGSLPGSSASPDVEQVSERVEVLTNNVALPQVALPSRAVGSPFPAGSWHLTLSGVAELTSSVGSYTAEYVDIAPTPEQFGSFAELEGAGVGDLGVDPQARAEVRTLLDDITDEADAVTPFEVAVAVQDRLRSTEYSYSEDLAKDTARGEVAEEPLVRFLRTKTGYCVQFATAMVMLAREAGIPARMAVGYLPGAVDGQERVVLASDAHAWPELWFPRLGWVYFEPTPGARTGVAPAYTRESTAPEDNAVPAPAPSASSSAPTPDRPLEDVPAGETTDTGGLTDTGVRATLARQWPTVVVVLALLVVLAVLPLGAWLARRGARRRARSDADRVEAEWQSLLLRLGDVGYVPADGATPRQASRELVRAAYLDGDEEAAFGRVVDTLERARYAPPGDALPDIGQDARLVRRAALGRRRRSDRLRAALLPEEGRRHWRRLLSRRTDDG